MKPTFDNLPQMMQDLNKRVDALEMLLNTIYELLQQQQNEKPTQQLEIPYLYTVTDIMKMYGVGRTNVYKWFKRGLRVTKMGRLTYVKPHHMAEFEKLNNQLTRLKKSA